MKDQGRETTGSIHCTGVANTTVVPTTTTTGGVHNGTADPGEGRNPQATAEREKAIPTRKPDESVSGEALRDMFQAIGMSQATTDIMTASWVENTRKQYALVLQRWVVHCERTGINAQKLTSNTSGIEYMEILFTEGPPEQPSTL